MASTSDITLDLFQWTVSDYHRLIETGIIDEDSPIELLNGQIVKMSPVGDLHAACVDRLNELLRDLLGKTVNFRIQSPVSLGKLSEPEPDVAILKRKENFYADGHPKAKDILLLIEVADSTLVKDRQIKAPAYASAGVKEYWIINLLQRQVEQYLIPSENGYLETNIYLFDQEIKSDLIPSLQVKLLFPQKSPPS